jgi:hypothetical protein
MIIRFDRHQLFTEEMMAFHSQTIRLVEDFWMANDNLVYSDLLNALMGIWDGYLYDDIIAIAYMDGLPEELISRIQTTIDFIQK